MQIKDLDGTSHNWQLTGNMARGKINNRSSFHLQARELITNIFPTLQILEEVPIPLRRSENLYLDFYLPLKKLCIEVHGEQHYKFSRFFHNTALGFIKHKKRDQDKKEWCELNNITHIELPFDKKDEWIKRIKNEY
jgi:hypothetical protein